MNKKLEKFKIWWFTFPVYLSSCGVYILFVKLLINENNIPNNPIVRFINNKNILVNIFVIIIQLIIYHILFLQVIRNADKKANKKANKTICAPPLWVYFRDDYEDLVKIYIVLNMLSYIVFVVACIFVNLLV